VLGLLLLLFSKRVKIKVKGQVIGVFCGSHPTLMFSILANHFRKYRRHLKNMWICFNNREYHSPCLDLGVLLLCFFLLLVELGGTMQTFAVTDFVKRKQSC
jgi:hypothetical protein